MAPMLFSSQCATAPSSNSPPKSILKSSRKSAVNDGHSSLIGLAYKNKLRSRRNKNISFNKLISYHPQDRPSYIPVESYDDVIAKLSNCMSCDTRPTQRMVNDFMMRTAIYLGYPTAKLSKRRHQLSAPIRDWLDHDRNTETILTEDDVILWRRLAYYDWKEGDVRKQEQALEECKVAEEAPLNQGGVLHYLSSMLSSMKLAKVDENKEDKRTKEVDEEDTKSDTSTASEESEIDMFLEMESSRENVLLPHLVAPVRVAKTHDLSLLTRIANSCVNTGDYLFTESAIRSVCNRLLQSD